MRELEDEAIRSGLDLPRVLGELPPGSGEGTRTYAPPEHELVLHIRLANPSPNLSRSPRVDHALPHELTADDVIDAGGLQLKRDARSGALSVTADAVDIAPGEGVAFAIRIRDVWSGETARCNVLRADALAIRA